MEKMQIQELVSALADGQLQGDAFAQGVELAASDPVAREAWHAYHLIGDVLRSGELTAATVPAAFISRLQLRLRAEQAQATRELAPAAPISAAVLAVAPLQAANDSSFRWKLVAGFASVAAMAAIGWTVLGGLAGKADPGQIAVVPAGAVLAGSEPGVMIRDARLDEFLAAHRQLGGASALQMPAGFLRNATFEGASR